MCGTTLRPGTNPHRQAAARLRRTDGGGQVGAARPRSAAPARGREKISPKNSGRNSGRISSPEFPPLFPVGNYGGIFRPARGRPAVGCGGQRSLRSGRWLSSPRSAAPRSSLKRKDHWKIGRKITPLRRFSGVVSLHIVLFPPAYRRYSRLGITTRRLLSRGASRSASSLLPIGHSEAVGDSGSVSPANVSLEER